MAIKARLRAIESRIGVVPCECQNEKIEVVTLHPGEAEPPARVCPKCGRTIAVIIVKYIEEGLWDAL